MIWLRGYLRIGLGVGALAMRIEQAIGACLKRSAWRQNRNPGHENSGSAGSLKGRIHVVFEDSGLFLAGGMWVRHLP